MDSVGMSTLTNLKYYLKSRHPDKELSLFEHGIAGLGCGVAVSIVATPIEVLKSRLQIQYDQQTRTYSGPVVCARQLVSLLIILTKWN